MTEHFNPFQPESYTGAESGQGTGKKNSGGDNTYLIIVVLAIAVLGVLGYIGYSKVTSASKSKSDTFSYNPVVQQLKNDSVQFCNYFYNLSYTSYKEARRKAELYMTSNLLTNYKETFYETQFTDEIINSRLSTDYIYNQVLEGVIDGKAAIKIIGNIKYTSTVKNVSVEVPITTILFWVKDANGIWKIDNLIIES